MKRKLYLELPRHVTAKTSREIELLNALKLAQRIIFESNARPVDDPEYRQICKAIYAAEWGT